MGLLDEAFDELTIGLIDALVDDPATFTRRVEASFNPATDTTVAATPLIAQIKTSPPKGYSAFLINGTSILSGDRRVIVGSDWGALGAPQRGDEIVRGELVGKVWKIEPINSGDAVVAYKLQIRTP